MADTIALMQMMNKKTAPRRRSYRKGPSKYTKRAVRDYRYTHSNTFRSTPSLSMWRAVMPC